MIEGKVSTYFSWDEVLKDQGLPAPEIIAKLKKICSKLDVIREFLGHPIIITSGYRTEAHNKEIGGAPKSAHLTGEAIDFTCPKYGDADDIRYVIGPHLWFLGIRCEDLPGSDWVHIDLKGKGFFKP
jgi:hypothetical protein